MNRTNKLLAVVCLAQFMVILDVSIVNVALPSIHNALGFSETGLQWVVNAYTLTFAGLLMLGGRAADLLGQRRMFLIGTALFSLSSLACALADARGALIAARALQGIGGAILSPATLALITGLLPEGPERNRGLGLWGAMGALGASSGALLGGLLTQALGWQAIFAVNVPLGAIVIGLGMRTIPRTAGLAHTRRLDLLGAVTMTIGLVSLTYGIVNTGSSAWLSAAVLGPALAGLALLGAFVLVERRFAVDPLVPLSIFRIGRLRTANIVIVLLYGAMFPTWFFLTLFLQQVLGYDAIEAGVSFLPMTLSIFATSSLAPRIVRRFGATRVIVAGMLCGTAGMGLLTTVSPGAGYVGTVLLGAILSAVGMGLALVPCTIVAMQGVVGSQSGLASGVLNTSRLVGGALGLAVLSTIADAQTHAGHGAGALTGGFDLAFALGALLCLAGAGVALRLRRPAPIVVEDEVVEEMELEAAGV